MELDSHQTVGIGPGDVAFSANHAAERNLECEFKRRSWRVIVEAPDGHATLTQVRHGALHLPVAYFQLYGHHEGIAVVAPFFPDHHGRRGTQDAGNSTRSDAPVQNQVSA